MFVFGLFITILFKILSMDMKKRNIVFFNRYKKKCTEVIKNTQIKCFRKNRIRNTAE